MSKMKFYTLLLVGVLGFSGFAQEDDKAKLKAERKATDLVYDANALLGEENYVEAEMEYRKAISKAPNKAVGSYNLAHSYYKKGSFKEALYRSEEAAKNASTKDEKHRAYHNIGNILMQYELCKEAVEAFKNALRNNPNDDETRYNYALAKECAEQQKDGGGEDNKEDENKEEEKDKEKDEKKENDKNEDQDAFTKKRKEGEALAKLNTAEKEHGGYEDSGLKEPTRFNDWESKGRCTDF